MLNKGLESNLLSTAISEEKEIPGRFRVGVFSLPFIGFILKWASSPWWASSLKEIQSIISLRRRVVIGQMGQVSPSLWTSKD